MSESEPVEMTNTPDGGMPDGTTTTTTEAELEATRAALAKANKEAAKYRHEANKLAEEQQKRKEAEMSEMDKLQAQLQQTTRELETLRVNDLKRKVASAVGLPDALALRLQGADEDELRADAEALLKTIPKAQPTPPQIKATNPGGNGEPPRETLEQQRARLYGRTADIFSPAWATQHGGGVMLPNADTKK